MCVRTRIGVMRDTKIRKWEGKIEMYFREQDGDGSTRRKAFKTELNDDLFSTEKSGIAN